MPDITISITDTEKKALEYAMVDISEWTDNAVTNRARIAKDEIISLVVAHCNANSVAIATGEDAQITQAYTLGVVKTAVQQNADAAEADADKE